MTSTSPRTADAVVVGGGTIGAWCAWFLREAGVADVVLLESGTLGAGASPRAAGMVRAQGGTETAVRLGLFSRDFYAGRQDQLGIDSGFVAQGYFLPCFSEREVADGPRSGSPCSSGLGLDVRWVGPDEFDRLNPAMSPQQTLGATFAPGDGYIDPPRNVLAYTTALFAVGVQVLERTAFTGLDVRAGTGSSASVRRPVARSPRSGSCSPADRRWPRSAGGRRTDPRRRGTSPGGRDRSASGPGGGAGSRWCSTWPPASTGARRRAGSSGG